MIKREKRSKVKIGLALVWLASLTLTACGTSQDSPVTPAVMPSVSTGAGGVKVAPTSGAPFPARAGSPTPSPTSDIALAFPTPLDSPPPIFPTPTARAAALPTVADYTATAGVLAPQTDPPSVPTGQLAYIQAGNLWLIDDNGGNRKPLTTVGDIGADSPVAWDAFRDKVAYVSRSGEIWTVDLQGKRSQVFSPARAKLSAPAKLTPTPTTAGIPTLPSGQTPRPAETPKSGPVVSAPVWSPDGRYLAFTFYNADLSPLLSGEVWLAEQVGDKTSVTKIAEGFNPAWSQDGRSLAFLSRAENKQGPARPTVSLTPPGTSLLPGPAPTTVRPAQQAPENPVDQSTSPALTPKATPTQPNGLGANNSSPVYPTPTPIIFYPGGTPPNLTPLPPTPTLLISSLPSPTPTPTFPPVYLGTYVINRVMVYSPDSRKLTPLMDSDKLPEAFYDTSGQLRSYLPAPLQEVWWSPDGRFLGFSDRLSVLGVITVNGAKPTTWIGQPGAYAVYDFQWMPRADGAFFRVVGPNGSSQMNLITFNNSNQDVAGATGDVTNARLAKLVILPGQNTTCGQLAPSGSLFSYYDGTALVMVNPDGSLHVTYSDTDCPAWSPYGRTFAATHSKSDRTLTLLTVDQPQEHALLSARAVDRIFWLRSDPPNLGGAPPVPITTPTKP